MAEYLNALSMRRLTCESLDQRETGINPKPSTANPGHSPLRAVRQDLAGALVSSRL